MEEDGVVESSGSGVELMIVFGIDCVDYINGKLPNPSVGLVCAKGKTSERLGNVMEEVEKDGREVKQGIGPGKQQKVIEPVAGPSHADGIIPRRSRRQSQSANNTTTNDTTSPKRKRVDLNVPVIHMTKKKSPVKKHTSGVKIGPKCFLKRIGRGGPLISNVLGSKNVMSGVKTPIKTNRNDVIVKIGPKSYLQKIGRMTKSEEKKTDKNRLNNNYLPNPVKLYSVAKAKTQICVKQETISLSSSSSHSQQPQKVDSPSADDDEEDYDDDMSEEDDLFEKV
jgi:hypothetical protein